MLFMQVIKPVQNAPVLLIIPVHKCLCKGQLSQTYPDAYRRPDTITPLWKQDHTCHCNIGLGGIMLWIIVITTRQDFEVRWRPSAIANIITVCRVLLLCFIVVRLVTTDLFTGAFCFAVFWHALEQFARIFDAGNTLYINTTLWCCLRLTICE